MAIYVECSNTFINSRVNTGIQRVVRNIINNLGESGREVSPVIFDNIGWKVVSGIPAPYGKTSFDEYRADVYMASKALWDASRHFLATIIPFKPISNFFRNSKRQFGLNYLVVKSFRLLSRLSAIFGREKSNKNLNIGPGDTLVMLDSSWTSTMWDEVERLKKTGVNVVTVVYDLIPISHAECCDDGLVKVFCNWFSRAAKLSDSFLCISKFVGGCVKDELKKIGRENVPVEYFYLGSELDGVNDAATIKDDVLSVCEGQKKFILAVGTIEPRKRYDLVMDAYEKYVESYGADVNLVLVGKVGWKVEKVVNKIKSNPLFERGLYLFNGLSDSELNMLYEKCSALVFASDIEGFGLPLVEARQKGIPVIASDIPVFREIADEGVTFFTAGDAASLKTQIKRFVDGQLASDVEKMTWLSWQESTQMFMTKVHELS